MARRIWGRPLVALGVVAVLAAGCGSDDGEDAGDDSSTTETTAKDDKTTTTGEGTTTTGDDYPGSTTTTSGSSLPDEPPFHDDAASGSGCNPGPRDLGDGWWYGTLEGPPGAEVSFDLACYYVGTIAEAKAASRGDEVTNDYYVVNDNEQVRAVPLAGGATGSCVELGATLDSVDCAPAEMSGDWAVWIRVQDGYVDRIVEQYAP
jgi:hypothetical protein